MLMRMQSSWNSHMLLVEMQNGTVTRETVWQVLKKLNIYSPYNPAICLLGIYPSEMKTMVTKSVSICL